MADYSIEAQPRTVVGKKVGQLRVQGLVPCIVYGPKIQPVNIQVPYRPLEIALMKAGGTSLIDIQVDGRTHTVLAREVQRDILKGTIKHVDFFAVDQASTIRTEVPLHFVNESPAVEARQGILVTGTNSVTVEVLPADLIQGIEVDLSVLKNVGDAIYVSDLKVGNKVTIINDPEEMVARVTQTSAARAEEDLEAAEATSAEPEVIARGKEDEDEE